MSALAALRSAGLTVTTASGRLVIEPPSALTDELRTLIRERKPEILKALASETAPDTPPASFAEVTALARALEASLPWYRARDPTAFALAGSAELRRSAEEIEAWLRRMLEHMG